MRSCSSTRTRAASCCCSSRRTRLTKVVPLGISSPIVDVPFAAAKHALEAVIESNQRLFDKLDVERFFFSVRPYYKPYRVGRQEYRGANAGDFSGHQRDRPVVRPVPRQRSVLRAAARRQDAVHAAGRTRRGCASACGTRVFSMSCWRWRRRTRARTGSSAMRARTSSSASLFGRYRQPAPRPAREALHRSAGGAARRGAPRGHHRERPAAAGAAALARSAARHAARGESFRHRDPSCRFQAPPEHGDRSGNSTSVGRENSRAYGRLPQRNTIRHFALAYKLFAVG